jgi:uncharacterized protein YggE
MSASGRVSPIVACLVVAVIILASSAVYLGYMVRSSGNTGSSSASSNVVITHPTNAGSLASSSATSSDPPSNSITVTGTSQVSYTPNEALLDVSVVTEAATAQAATGSNAGAVANVIKALNQIGVGNSSIQTQGFSLDPDYANNYGGTSVPQILGYTVTNTLMVNLTSGSATQLGLMAGKAIDTSVSAGANQVSLQFAATNSMLAHLNDQALRQAVSSASEQAQVIASSLGVSVTGVTSAVQGGYYSQTYYPVYTALAAAAPATTTPIVPGTQTASATVTVIYAIS